MRRRLQASAALLLLAAAVVLTAVVAVEGFPRGITVLACLVLALAAAWWGLVRRGAARMVAFSVAALLLAGAVIVTVFEGTLLADAVIEGKADAAARQQAQNEGASPADSAGATTPEVATTVHSVGP